MTADLGIVDMPVAHSPSEQERAMADEKARLSKEIQDLQHDMQQQERSLASTQPGASSKMRKALSDAEQNELAMREQKTAEWMKQGYGDRNLGVETKMAEGLEQLSRDLQEVQKSVEAGDGMANPGKATKGEQHWRKCAIFGRCWNALSKNADSNKARARVINSRICRVAISRGSNRVRSATRRSTARWPAAGRAATRRRDIGGQYGPMGGADYYGMDQQSLQGAIDDLTQWRGKIDPHDRQFRGTVDDTFGYLRCCMPILTGCKPQLDRTQ